MSVMTARSECGDAAGGDRLSALYRLHASDAKRFAYLLCGDEELAADVVQEAFLRVARRLGALRNPDAFPWYLRRTIRNLVFMHGRAHGREQARLGRSQGMDAALHVSRIADESPHDELWLALQRLPARQRAALVCRYYLDLSERDTARVLACRPGTVKSLVSRGIAAMRRDERLDELDG
jgi:RNA polymerase sigma factor (sigma-70 family)